MRGRWRLRVVVASAVAFAAVVAPIAVSAHSSRHHHHRQRGAGTISHVLLISVDGLHQDVLDWYARNHPSSALAKLASGGLQYARARTPVPTRSCGGCRTAPRRPASFAAHYLMTHPATGNTVSGASRTLPSSGLTKVYAGPQAARYFGVPTSDPRHPDVWGIVQHGVVYTGGTKTIAEHGGANPEDRDVALVVFAPRTVRHRRVNEPVETTQIAPTILQLLGINPRLLQAVRIEHTEVLPGA